MFFLFESFVFTGVRFFVFLPSTVLPLLTFPDVPDGVVSEVLFFLGDFLGDFFEEVASLLRSLSFAVLSVGTVGSSLLALPDDVLVLVMVILLLLLMEVKHAPR